jgi:DNA polymerase alpha subunit B
MVCRLASFADRKDAGAIQESLNTQIEIPGPTDILPPEPRFKLKANTEVNKFSYKTMAMKLSEASEILDDRIDEIATIIQEHYKLEEGAFGNPASQSQNEIVVVGRIASDANEGKLNSASLVIETSRRTGAGLRVPLKVDALQSYQFFPGKIVALKGTNASGEFFSVTEILDIPLLFPVASSIETVDGINDRIAQEDGTVRPLVTIVAAGPYTTEDALDFSPFHALLAAVEDIKADALVLLGPFIDAEHPQVRTGDFDLPANYPVSPDKVTLNDLFRAHISSPLQKLTQSLPSLSIIMCPSVRDAVSKHAAWPQDRLVKKELGLPGRVSLVPNPMLLSLNEILFGMSSQDVLDQLRSTEIVGGKARHAHIMDRLCRQLIEQRHFFPVLPPVERQRTDETAEGISYAPLGPMLDISYLKLGEWLGVKPDVLLTPSGLPPFAKVCA